LGWLTFGRLLWRPLCLSGFRALGRLSRSSGTAPGLSKLGYSLLIILLTLSLIASLNRLGGGFDPFRTKYVRLFRVKCLKRLAALSSGREFLCCLRKSCRRDYCGAKKACIEGGHPSSDHRRVLSWGSLVERTGGESQQPEQPVA
jgi:hypothetical protein